MMHRHQAKDATTHPRESPLATEQQCCSQVTVDACDKNNALEGEKMKSAVIACLLLILALALAGCQSQTAHCYSSPPPRAMRSTVFNTTQHRALAQSNGTADVPASSQWYYARRDVPPAVITGYVTQQSEQRVTVTRDRNSSNSDDYNRTTYTRRSQTVTW